MGCSGIFTVAEVDTFLQPQDVNRISAAGLAAVGETQFICIVVPVPAPPTELAFSFISLIALPFSSSCRWDNVGMLLAVPPKPDAPEAGDEILV